MLWMGFEGICGLFLFSRPIQALIGSSGLDFPCSSLQLLIPSKSKINLCLPVLFCFLLLGAPDSPEFFCSMFAHCIWDQYGGDVAFSSLSWRLQAVIGPFGLDFPNFALQYSNFKDERVPPPSTFYYVCVYCYTLHIHSTHLLAPWYFFSMMAVALFPCVYSPSIPIHYR